MMDRKVKVSVIIPAFNAAESVRNAVDGLLKQDYQDLEVILVDDGSTDGTGQVCDVLAAMHGNVHVIHKSNGGVSSARNVGLQAASGEYVMFLDADDVLKPDTLMKMTDTDADLVMGGFEKVSDGRVTEVNVPPFMKDYIGNGEICRFLDDNIGEKDCFLLNSSCFKLYRRSLIAAHSHRFDEGLRYGEDKIFVFGFLRFVRSVCTIPEVVYEYRIQKESLSSDVSSDSHLMQLLRLIGAYVPLLKELKELYGESVRLYGLYHADVISRYVCRILTCFALRHSSLMTENTMKELYSYMSEDDRLSVISLRLGQIPNYLLFRIGNIRLSMILYSFTSSICRYICFR